MRTVSIAAPMSVVSLVVLVGCAAEPASNIAGTLAASHSSSFSAWSDPVSLGSTINSSFNDQQAALSKDGLSLYFASNRPGTTGTAGLQDIWVSHRDCLACSWLDLTNLGPSVNTAFSDAAPALSRDGHWLFFLSNRPGSMSSDIWVSWREHVHDDFGWEASVNLGPGVNTAGFEGGPSYFENDEVGVPQLYFNRNPQPVNTGGDIYVSEQAPDGSFGTASPVAALNSPSSDQRPSIAHNGLEIYFFSDRPGSGSDDIWFSTRESVLAPWSPPTNLGSPINTEVGERHPLIVSHGGTEWLYFARNVATPPAIDLDLFVSTRTRGGKTP
jgi:WD40 repeat protein